MTPLRTKESIVANAPGGAGAVGSVNGKTGVVVLNQDEVLDGTTYKQYSQTEKTKLSGIFPGATVNSTDATLLARANHTGTQSADTIVDGSTNHVFTTADDTKLTGIAAGATQNSPDATLLARANHTGSQAISTVTNLQTTLDGKATLSTGGTFAADILVPDEVYGGAWNGSLEVPTKNAVYDKIETVVAGGGGLTQEQVEDFVAALFSAGTHTKITVTYNDTTPSLSVAVTGLTKSDVGLGNVDNTSDANAPVSTAQQTALDLKAPLASPTFTGTVTVPYEAYGAGWNGANTAPTKDALYDKIETLTTTISTASGHFTYTYNTTLTEPPIGNQLRLNNATQSAATRLWLSESTFDGLDVSLGLAKILAGHYIYIQDYDDASKWVKYTVTADGVDDGTYYDYSIVYHSGPGGIPGGKVEIQTISPGATAAIRTINTYSGTSLTGVLADAAAYIRCTGSNPTYTIPPNSSVVFPVGTQIDGVGTATAMTLVAGGGVTVNKARTLVTLGAKSGWTALKVATDEWDVHGDFV